mmetsp:Transcript_32/g.113  ORF Transcript_32/g.113 Transcript_32/m.113 type:complete len:453 (+) Transcript_32:80-1438(+)
MRDVQRFIPLQTSGTDYDSGEDGQTDGSDSGHSKGKKHADVCANGFASYLNTSLTAVLLGSPMNVLMLATPLAFISKFAGWRQECTFIFSLIALIPFAERVSFVTEDVAQYTNDTLGGLLNATFGNITELIVSIFALKAGLLRVVQVSMLGSVLSNLLLVLGSAFLVGGLRHHEQTFNKVAATTNSGLLTVSVLALSLPSILDATHTGSQSTEGHNLTDVVALVHASASGPAWLSANGNLEEETGTGGDAPLWLSRFIAGVMLILYGMLIFFQVKTHTHLYEGEEEDDDQDPPVLGLWGGIFWLSIITFFISLLSDFIIDAIEGAAEGLGVPILFLSGILVPIVGNAAEHAASITFAWRNKMEISLGSAVGSAVQIAVFVIPLCVMIGWAFGQDMTLNFHIYETVVLMLTCLTVSFLLQDGKSHWLKGATLFFAYIMIAAAFWAHADPKKMS